MENHIMNHSALSPRLNPVCRVSTIAVVFGLLSTGCSFGDTLEPYYVGTAPSIDSLSSTSEEGNIGGATVMIAGSDFGSDPQSVTVVFGSQNAAVLLANDTELEVVVPRGPIEGGFVDVVVGTASGQMRVEDGYEYDVTLGTGEDIFEDQVAYIAVTDDYFSCGGGIGHIIANPDLLVAYGWNPALVSVIRDEGRVPWSHGGDENEDGIPDENQVYSPYETFCNEGLVFGGYVGIEGRSELIEFAYPRIHSLFAGYRNGFGGNFDVSPEKWSVQVPSQDVIGVDIEGFYRDLRTEIDDFVITNVDVLEAQPQADDRKYCSDLSALVDVEYVPEASHVQDNVTRCLFNGTRVNAPFYMELEDCDEPTGRWYDLAEMKFCQADDYENTRSYRYEAEWPVGEYFFRGANPTPDDDDSTDDALAYVAPTTIQLDVPEAGISGVEIELPEAAVFKAGVGWNTGYFDPSINEEMKGIYGLLGFEGACADPDGDGMTTGEEIAATVQWRPSEVELTSGGEITGARTFVRFTITAAGFGWYGGEGAVMKATITVPDTYNVDVGDEEDPTDDVSTIEIPAAVLYQVPSILQNFGGIDTNGNSSSSLTDTCGDYLPGADISFDWAQSDVVNYGFVITQAERVTEYAVEAPDLGGDLVFAYSSGDIGYTVFGTAADESPSWLNPVDSNSTCGDCQDGDGDGWADAEDPDCTASDLDGDGVPDTDPSTLQEDNSQLGVYSCNDLIDNDEDGDIDSEDGNCGSAFEEEHDCLDGRDNDRDGWIDADDPDCGVDGVGFENGLSELPCNDGIDNDNDGIIDDSEVECESAADRETTCANGRDDDGDGLTDSDDPECADEFDLVEDVFNNTNTTCNDGVDNDADGWVDLDDPDCPLITYDEEGLSDFGCNNGIDDDGQGDVDLADPSCVAAGAMGDETPVFTAGCADGADNDGDGYTDGNDPDCEYPPYSIERNLYLDPTVYSDVPACYNGLDDDGNGDVDALDPDCVNSFAEPSGFVMAEDPIRPECTNGFDDDGDGWMDGADPDCSTGDTEDGYAGAAECNDGVDNDGDTLVDAEDPDCTDAESTESD
jgi:hypothetical protein